MSLKQLDLATLKALDGGKAFEAFATHLKRAALDCYDRPGDSKPRKVVLEVGVVPILEPEAGGCDKVKLQIHASSTVPKHKTRVYEAGLRRNGTLVFNEDSPESVDQGTLLDGEGD